MLEPEPKNLDACSWSLKFEFRLHSPGSSWKISKSSSQQDKSASKKWTQKGSL